MVSFSCDNCQNVFTKPKIEAHISRCRTRTVSCIDCGTEFTSWTVGKHSSCITEAEKYGDKSESKQCTQTRCGLCGIQLNGAVHAEQHYTSKKHRAKQRQQKQITQQQVHKVPETVVVTSVHKTDGKNSKNGLKLKKHMKKVLRSSKKGKMKKQGLIEAVKQILGKDAPSELSDMVDREIVKSKRFDIRKGRVRLLEQIGS